MKALGAYIKGWVFRLFIERKKISATNKSDQALGANKDNESINVLWVLDRCVKKYRDAKIDANVALNTG